MLLGGNLPMRIAPNVSKVLTEQDIISIGQSTFRLSDGDLVARRSLC
jgi:hypothetical protein